MVASLFIFEKSYISLSNQFFEYIVGNSLQSASKLILCINSTLYPNSNHPMFFSINSNCILTVFFVINTFKF